MEDNKEVMNSELETENSNNETDTFTEENMTQTDAQTVSDETEVAEDTKSDAEDEVKSFEIADELNASDDKPAKKKRVLQTSIIISIIIVAVVALGFLVYACFFNTSIVGTWSMQMEDTSTASSDEAAEDSTTYYIFGDNNVVTVAFGTVEHKGTYSLSTDENGSPVVSFEVPSLSLSVSFEYNVTGNIFTGRKLTFKDSMYNYEYTFNSKERKIPQLKVDDGFKANDEVVGSWNYFDGYYNFTYEFSKDGKVRINQNDMIYIDGVYSFTDDVITIKYFTDQELTTEMVYKADGDKLDLNGLPYYRTGSASADEAREKISKELAPMN